MPSDDANTPKAQTEPPTPRCPNGHLTVDKQGRVTRCSPVHCGRDILDISPTPLEEIPGSDVFRALDVAEAEMKVYGEMAESFGQYIARRRMAGLPAKSLEGQEADEWAGRKLSELKPVAVAELGLQLKYGSRKERHEAAKTVLDITTKQAAPPSQPLIVIKGNVTLEPPWRKKNNAAVTVDAEVTAVEKK